MEGLATESRAGNFDMVVGKEAEDESPDPERDSILELVRDVSRCHHGHNGMWKRNGRVDPREFRS